MLKTLPHILLLEPYYGGSHRAFLKGLQQHVPLRFSLISLPARKWKMRMQLAAPWMTEQTLSLVKKGSRFDAILCSSLLDVATLRALLTQADVNLPVAVYFHENQFAYPNRIADPAFYQFTALNFTSALAADAVAFNSSYNRETFLSGVARYIKKAADMNLDTKVEELRQKSCVLYPGIDFKEFDIVGERPKRETRVIVWNHRWEHDKDPETFFSSMMELASAGEDFYLVILGQHFTRCPTVFAEARNKLHRHILHFGYARKRKAYTQLLHQADIVVSTAIHEFFGMAVLEAVRCGCRPLVPDRLSYRELFPVKYRYDSGTLTRSVSSLLHQSSRLEKSESLQLTDRFSWQQMAPQYQQWLLSLF